MEYESDKIQRGKVLIPVVIIEFHDLPDFWLHKEQYEHEGKFKGILKALEISIREIKKVHHLLKYSSSFPTNAWEG